MSCSCTCMIQLTNNIQLVVPNQHSSSYWQPYSYSPDQMSLECNTSTVSHSYVQLRTCSHQWYVMCSNNILWLCGYMQVVSNMGYIGTTSIQPLITKLTKLSIRTCPFPHHLWYHSDIKANCRSPLDSVRKITTTCSVYHFGSLQLNNLDIATGTVTSYSIDKVKHYQFIVFISTNR